MRHRSRHWQPLAMLVITALLLSMVPQALPRAHAAPGSLTLLDDSTFVSAPGFDHLAVQAWLERQPGSLGMYQATLDGQTAPAAQVIAVASLGNPHEVSTKVMLTLLEVSAGLVTAPSPSAAALQRPFALLSPGEASFEAELFAMGALLRESFAAYDPSLAPQIQLADGSGYRRPPLPNAGTYALEVALGRLAPDAAGFERLIGAGEDSFRTVFQSLFGDAPAVAPQTSPLADTPLLSRPFAGSFRAGSFFDHNTRADAFMRFDGATNYGYDGHDGTDYPMAPRNTILAAADGVVVDVATNRNEGYPAARPRWCPSWAGYTPVTGMVVRHSVNGVEYKTTYWHLDAGAIGTSPRTGQTYRVGDTILRGEMLGLSGNTGCSTGAHLHFGVQRNGFATDPYGWCGPSADPYPYPSTNIWLETMTNPSPCPRAVADSTPPQIRPVLSGPMGANDWYTGAVDLRWELSDPESGIATSNGCGALTLREDTAGTTLTCEATNGAGLRASTSVSLKIDATPPVIDLAFHQVRYTRIETAYARIGIHDPQPGSGLASLEATFDNAVIEDGQAIDLFWRAPGVSTMRATARDHAGLVTTRTASFELIATLESLAKTIAELRQRREIASEMVAYDLLVVVGQAIAAWQRGENEAAARQLSEIEALIGASSAQISERGAVLLRGDSAYIKEHLAPRDGLPQPPAPPRNLMVRAGRTTLLIWEPSPSAWSHGYHVYRQGSQEHDFTRITATPLNELSYADTSVSEADTYTYYVTAIDEYGRESEPSNADRAFAGQLRLELPTVRAAPGMTVRVPVQVEYADGLCLEAVDVGVAYDPKIATPAGVSRSALTDSYSFVQSVRRPGEVHIAAVGPCSDFYGAGALFWINFTIAPTATVQSSLEFIQGLTGTTIYDSADLAQPLSLKLSDGAIRVDAVRPQLRGDLNGDGVINAADAALVMRIVVGLLIPNADQRMTGDVNADGLITAADATLILYYAAQQAWPESLPTVRLATLATADSTLRVTPESPAATAGESVMVPIAIDDSTAIAGASLLLQHGPGLIYQGATLDPDLERRGFSLATRATGDGEVRIGFAGAEGLASGRQRLVWLQFQVAEEAANSTTWMQVAGAWLNDHAGRDFSTTGMRRTITGEQGRVILNNTSNRVFIPLVQR